MSFKKKAGKNKEGQVRSPRGREWQPCPGAPSLARARGGGGGREVTRVLAARWQVKGGKKRMREQKLKASAKKAAKKEGKVRKM